MLHRQSLNTGFCVGNIIELQVSFVAEPLKGEQKNGYSDAVDHLMKRYFSQSEIKYHSGAAKVQKILTFVSRRNGPC